jgi:nitroimidazol reductase NimA-like FMN-containing flavoprotein (pyridoxamine 5'-phosphate oxidase superfamily)
MNKFPPTKHSKVRRIPNRGHYDKETIYPILDEGFVCHLGFIFEDRPFVIPTADGRSGDKIYLHGSSVSRMMRELSKSVDVCITVTLVDGLVLARSIFHHSMNYRSVVILGKAILLEDEEEKILALKAFSDHVLPGRWDDVRQPSKKELKATSVLSVEIVEASAKVRKGDPVDDEEDLNIDTWSGTIPLTLTAGNAIPAANLQEGVLPAPNILAYQKRR